MIAIGADHGGYRLKEEIKKYFEENSIEYEDYGTYSEERTDYPIYAKKVAEAMVNGSADKGILICRSWLLDTSKGLKIAVPKEFFGEGINEEVKENLEKSIETYKELGAEVSEVSLDIAEYALASYYIIACAEASSNLGRFDGVRYGHRAKEYSLSLIHI